MSPTSWRVLLGCAVVAGLLGYLLGEAAYGDLPELQPLAPVTLGLLAVVEALMARVVRERVRGPVRRGARALLPEQVARAAVLAKASSPTGALLAGGYGGLLGFLLLSDGTAAAADDRPVAVASVLTALALVGAALLLERACRLPPDPEDELRTATRVVP